ncbi:MAG: hypothetical protein H7230_03405 [Candidatus Parcubacteria bacterium]|nr:hypothetical protein [Candidatus Paceibacterota bacterium]
MNRLDTSGQLGTSEKLNNMSRLGRTALNAIAVGVVGFTMSHTSGAKAIPTSFNQIKPSAQNVQISPESAKIQYGKFFVTGFTNQLTHETMNGFYDVPLFERFIILTAEQYNSFAGRYDGSLIPGGALTVYNARIFESSEGEDPRSPKSIFLNNLRKNPRYRDAELYAVDMDRILEFGDEQPGVRFWVKLPKGR